MAADGVAAVAVAVVVVAVAMVPAAVVVAASAMVLAAVVVPRMLSSQSLLLYRARLLWPNLPVSVTKRGRKTKLD